MWRWLRAPFLSPRKRMPPRAAPPLDERLSELLREVRGKLDEFLVTRSAGPGPIRKTGEWSLARSGPGLFKLEFAQGSLLITTRPFLLRKDGRVQGLLQMSEVALCKAISGGGPISEFLMRSEPPSEESRPLFDELTGKVPSGPPPEVLPPMSLAATLNPAGFDQVLVNAGPNVLAHALLHADAALADRIRGRLSDRHRSLLILELESLEGGGDRSTNPHSRVFGLLDFEDALRAFRRALAGVLAKGTGPPMR